MSKKDIPQPYKAAGLDCDGRPYVEGPGNGLGYFGGALYPHLRWESEELAERVAEVANIAFREGYRRAQAEMRAALGLADE